MIEEHNESVSAWLTDFEADRIATAESLLSMPVLSDADAAESLNQRIPWTDGSNRDAPLKLPADLMTAISVQDWAALEKSIVNGLDFSWLTQNIAWARWTIWNADPVRAWFSAQNVSGEPPRPDYAQMIAWAKLRYIHGIHNDDLIAAQSELRQLARLIETNEHPEASRTALAIIALEQDIARTPQAQSAEFEAFPQPLLERIASMLWFFESAAHPATRDDLVRKIITFKEPHFGLCGVLAGYAFIRSVGVFRPLPFRDTTKVLDKFAKTSACRRDYEKHLVGGIAVSRRLGQHPFLKSVAEKEFSYLLFKDTIGLIVDMSTVTDAGRYYRTENKGAG